MADDEIQATIRALLAKNSYLESTAYPFGRTVWYKYPAPGDVFNFGCAVLRKSSQFKYFKRFNAPVNEVEQIFRKKLYSERMYSGDLSPDKVNFLLSEGLEFQDDSGPVSFQQWFRLKLSDHYADAHALHLKNLTKNAKTNTELTDNYIQDIRTESELFCQKLTSMLDDKLVTRITYGPDDFSLQDAFSEGESFQSLDDGFQRMFSLEARLHETLGAQDLSDSTRDVHPKSTLNFDNFRSDFLAKMVFSFDSYVREIRRKSIDFENSFSMATGFLEKEIPKKMIIDIFYTDKGLPRDNIDIAQISVEDETYFLFVFSDTSEDEAILGQSFEALKKVCEHGKSENEKLFADPGGKVEAAARSRGKSTTVQKEEQAAPIERKKAVMWDNFLFLSAVFGGTGAALGMIVGGVFVSSTGFFNWISNLFFGTIYGGILGLLGAVGSNLREFYQLNSNSKISASTFFLDFWRKYKNIVLAAGGVLIIILILRRTFLNNVEAPSPGKKTTTGGNSSPPNTIEEGYIVK
jgi:hypothetical protein